MRLVRSLTVTVSSLALAAAVGTTPGFFLHDSPSRSTNTNAVTRAVVNFGAPRTVTTAVVNFGAPPRTSTDFSAISSSHAAAPQSLLIF